MKRTRHNHGATFKAQVALAASVGGREQPLKRLVEDLSLDKHMLSEALRKKSEVLTPSRNFWLVSGHLPVKLHAGLLLGAVWSSLLASMEVGKNQ